MGIQLTSFCAVTADWRGAEWRGDSWQENFNIANTEIQIVVNPTADENMLNQAENFTPSSEGFEYF